MRRLARLGIGVALFACATDASAQSFNSHVLRYQAARRACEQQHAAQVSAVATENGHVAADRQKAQCLSTAEERYRAVLRRALRLRN